MSHVKYTAQFNAYIDRRKKNRERERERENAFKYHINLRDELNNNT